MVYFLDCIRDSAIPEYPISFGSAVEHSLHTRGVSSSNLLAGTNIFDHMSALIRVSAMRSRARAARDFR
jgi:hypothetical protein